MERAGFRRGACAGGSPCAIDADRQAHQCGFSERSLDAAGQHHEPRAQHGAGVSRAALVRIDGERAAAVTAPAGLGQPTSGGSPRAGLRQEAAGAEAAPRVGTRSAFACGARRRRASSCGGERVMLSKPAAWR